MLLVLTGHIKQCVYDFMTDRSVFVLCIDTAEMFLFYSIVLTIKLGKESETHTKRFIKMTRTYTFFGLRFPAALPLTHDKGADRGAECRQAERDQTVISRKKDETFDIENSVNVLSIFVQTLCELVTSLFGFFCFCVFVLTTLHILI